MVSPASSSRGLLTRSFDAANAVLDRNPVWALAVGGVLALQLTLIWTHQAWADEYQALLLAYGTWNQTELLAWLRYEGHPPAWYWLLHQLLTMLPFAWVLPTAATLCAIVVQGTILFASPFTRAEKLLLASSQYVLFEFLTISRGTSLGVAFVMLALVFWRSRWLWLIMATLPTVDFLFGVISGVFLILKWRERDLWWPGVAIWLAASAFAGWSVIPAPDMVSASEAMNMPSGPLIWFMMMGSLPLPFQGGIAPQWNTPVVPIALAAWPVMLWLCWHLTAGHNWQRLLIFGFFGFTLAFSLAVYPIGLRHLMLGCLLLIAMVWLQRSANAPSSSLDHPVWRIWLIALAFCGLSTSALSTARGFDTAPEIVSEIQERGLENKRWIALPEWRAPAIAGRTNLRFERLGKDCTFTFVRWDHAYSALASKSAFEDALRQNIAAHGRGYLLSDREFSGLDPDLISLLARTGKGYNGIAYSIYVIGRNAPENSRDLPSCYRSKRASNAR